MTCAAGDEHKELMRKDIIDLKRAMNDEIHEKEATQKSANDLRNMVKKAEAEKIELNRSLQDAGQKIAGQSLRQKDGSPLARCLRCLAACAVIYTLVLICVTPMLSVHLFSFFVHCTYVTLGCCRTLLKKLIS